MHEQRKRAPLAGLSIVAVVASLSLAASAWAEATWRPDAWITTKTKIAIATDSEVEAGDVNVDTVNGRVTLHGKVATAAEKTKAEQIARGIEGTTEVRNLLQVVAAEKMTRIERKDEDIQKAVDAALDADPELRSSSIDVQSVNNGVVLLGGSTDTLLAHLEAIRTASSVDGVRRVETEAETGDRLYDEKLWHDADTAREKGVIDRAADATRDTGDAIASAGRATGDAIAGAAGTVRDSAKNAADETADATRDARDSTVGAAEDTSDAMSDAWITTSTKTRLLADPDTPAMSINVDTEDGVVTLFGTVPSEQARSAAIAHAKAANGNGTVRDELTIDPTAAGDDAAERPTDDQLAASVRQELGEKNKFASADIDVDVDDGIAKLTGTAPTHEIKMAAATTARSIDGVRAVKNEIRVQPKG